MSVIAKTTMRFGAIIVCFFVMVILYVLSSSSCTQLLKVAGDLEREIARQENTRSRESMRWEQMLTPENIERTLLANGLSMKPPKACQVIRMREDGLPRPGQMSVAAARQRNGLERLGRVDAPSSVSTTARRKFRR